MFKNEIKRNKTSKPPKKMWANTKLIKIDNKFKESKKLLKEPKPEDPIETKDKYVRTLNFFNRMQEHIREVLHVTSLLNIVGYAPLFYQSKEKGKMPQEKAEELSYLINLGMQNLIKPIPIPDLLSDVKTKLESFKTSEMTTEPVSSKIVVSMCNYSLWYQICHQYEFIMSALNPQVESYYYDANKVAILHRSILFGASRTAYIKYMINYFTGLLKDEAYKIKFKNY